MQPQEIIDLLARASKYLRDKYGRAATVDPRKLITSVSRITQRETGQS